MENRIAESVESLCCISVQEIIENYSSGEGLNNFHLRFKNNLSILWASSPIVLKV